MIGIAHFKRLADNEDIIANELEPTFSCLAPILDNELIIFLIHETIGAQRIAQQIAGAAAPHLFINSMLSRLKREDQEKLIVAIFGADFLPAPGKKVSFTERCIQVSKKLKADKNPSRSPALSVGLFRPHEEKRQSSCDEKSIMDIAKSKEAIDLIEAKVINAEDLKTIYNEAGFSVSIMQSMLAQLKNTYDYIKADASFPGNDPRAIFLAGVHKAILPDRRLTF